METNQKTLGIIKPDGVGKGVVGNIISLIEAEGLRITAMAMRQLTDDDAKRFYKVHSERPFFQELVDYMASGPVVAMRLEGEGAIDRYRKLMGATDPREAEEGTIRKLYGEGISANVVHGSDGIETAEEELDFFFGQGSG